MHPKAFLELAKQLSQQDNPASLRSAVSRAYYSAFNIGKLFIGSCGPSISKGPEGHTQVCNYLQNAGDDTLSQMGTALQELRSKRNEADYDLAKTHCENKNNATLEVFRAGMILEAIEKCQNESVRLKTVKDGVKNYLAQRNSS